MPQPSDSSSQSPWAPLDSSVETFRRECESLDQLVEELFAELEDMNRRLGQKSAELIQQQEYLDQREGEWQQRHNEHQDLREFFVHQNDQIAGVVDKLALFEDRLGEAGSDSASDQMQGLLSDMRSEHEGMRQAREADESFRELESERWQQQFEQQNDQLVSTLEKLSALEEKLTEVSQSQSTSEASPELTQLIEEVREQHQWLREQAEASPQSDSPDDHPIHDQLSRQEEQLTQTLDKLTSFEEQLSGLALSDSTQGEASPQWGELLTEIRHDQEEFRQHLELERNSREQDHEALESFFARQGDHLDGTLGKLTAFEEQFNNLAESASATSEESSPQLTELLEELRTERDAFRSRFEQASEEANRLAELMKQFSAARTGSEGGEQAGDPEALAASQQLREELAVANSRVAELEQTVGHQQQELLEEKQLLREQLRELRELLELRSHWSSDPPPASEQEASPTDRGSQTISLDHDKSEESSHTGKQASSPKEKPGKDSKQESVLAQFAKLSRK